MTTPRDPIEAPAIILLEHLRKYPALETSMRLIETEIAAIEAEAERRGYKRGFEAAKKEDPRSSLRSARAEGRREAVRLREALEYLADRIEVSIRATEGTELFDALEGARAALDDVARPGRSSDPTESSAWKAVDLGGPGAGTR